MKTHSLPSFYNDDSAKYEHSESQSQYGMYWNSFIHRCKQKELSPSDVLTFSSLFLYYLLVIALRLENISYSKVNEKGKSIEVHFFWKCAFYSQYFLIEKQRKRHIYKDEMI